MNPVLTLQTQPPFSLSLSLSLSQPEMAAASASASIAVNGAKMATSSQAYIESNPVRETKALISELCRQFYNLGWVSGTGGSITIKVHDDSIPKPHQLIVMSPSGVQKERMLIHIYMYMYMYMHM
ncbi:probable bifunctional methylthioribulose-1-phosphate dehydratase/enolase-phosphatase E1 isoform X2 [Camellia sinensis]|uniref:probable bifunctional methylthioribulose-1-phosphate dehydratase/enolase-phosphatase E1 isoform X2 n=1 Tax=Camellia sinensis TaxID=4442 RepID=UPI001036777D|nr:probable bifunctional methylthioribulose-1-phosphate dehydratase/enolase-phosphatase E1 isoform X2 [Camellia sinensis]